MNWSRIVRAYAVSYAKERCEDAPEPIIDIEEVEPGLWRVLFTPALVSADDTVDPEVGMIVVTGKRQINKLPHVYRQFAQGSDEDGDPLLWGWPLAEMNQ